MVTVNGERLHSMIMDFSIPQVEDMDQTEINFQQDGKTCHTMRESKSLQLDHFPGIMGSRLGDVEWPARSLDLPPLDFFLWGPQILTELKKSYQH